MPSQDLVEKFIARWAATDADEQANSQPFLSELCDIIDVPRPAGGTSSGDLDAYTFEKRVKVSEPGKPDSTKRIDLYKRDCFILESKQGRHAVVPRGRFDDAPAPTKSGTAIRETGAYRDAMKRALAQAKRYAQALPADEEWPPFLVVVDVGYSIELFADFTRMGRRWEHFPHPSSSLIRIEDLRDPAVRRLLRTVWLDPMSLDPSARAARVTRRIAERLARLAVSLEEDGHDTDVASHFLMRCLFCMFAEDAELLPAGAFTDLLADSREDPSVFEHLMGSLFDEMNRGGFSATLRKKIRHFNGGLFALGDDEPPALPLDADQIGLLIEAAQADWREVEPAIFGTLLERALDARERHKLGAHYTPREYVERLVVPTVMEPLRREWDAARAAASQLEEEGDTPGAIRAVRTFHRRLCDVKVLDPACGSGNFLYVTLALMKRLEAEVLRTLEELDHKQAALEMEGFRVNPSQFLGIEINPRAAAVADLVLWIGYLQWQLATERGGGIPEPVLQAFGNIECRDALIEWDEKRPKLDEAGVVVTRWDGVTTKAHPVTGEQVPDEAAQVTAYEYVNPRRAQWPEAEFIVGNPPFVGNKRMRFALGDAYVDSLRSVWQEVPDTADLVGYWFAQIGGLLPPTRAAGLIATNSLSSVLNRGVLQVACRRGGRISFAVPDHPWTDGGEGAAVRISMVCISAVDQAARIGRLEAGSLLLLPAPGGSISPDLSGSHANTASLHSLRANRSMCLQGCKLVGAGFQVPEETAERWLGTNPDWLDRLPYYVTGSCLTKGRSPLRVIDFFGLRAEQARDQMPLPYQWVRDRVKPQRDQNRRRTRRENWWLFGENAPKLRRGLARVARYIATSEVAKHRFFVFLDADAELADGSLAAIPCDDAFVLGVLSSGVHVAFALRAGGRLGVGNDPRYQNGPCFDPFPFPDPPDASKRRIRELAEELDAHRKRQQAQHPKLTLTKVYNVLEKLRADEPLTVKDKTVYEQGLVSILRELHDQLDDAVLDAYGWPRDLDDEELLERLVALNHERAEEEQRGIVRWLRPEFQNPDGAESPTQTEALPAASTAKPEKSAAKQPWPESLAERIAAVLGVLAGMGEPVDVEAVAGSFKRARRAQVAAILDRLVQTGLAHEVDGGIVAAT